MTEKTAAHYIPVSVDTAFTGSSRSSRDTPLEILFKHSCQPCCKLLSEISSFIQNTLQTMAHINTQRSITMNSQTRLNKINVFSHFSGPSISTLMDMKTENHQNDSETLLKGRHSPNDGDDEV